jgi:large subunit ribosomal protein L17
MRHRRRGRTLGRSPSHRKALLKNLASALFLTERDAELDENAPKVAGRITTTLHKAKEVRSLVEKCITIAKKSLPHAEEAEKYATSAERGSDEYKQWRQSEDWQKWAAARAPVVAAQRRVVQLIGNKEATAILFDTIAERYVDRDGGYTRIVRLATPRLGDAGTRAILELVGKNDRVSRKAERPAFSDDDDEGDDNAPQADESTSSSEEQAEPVAAAAGSDAEGEEKPQD